MARHSSKTQPAAARAPAAASDARAGVRLDVWLWATRFFRTRALAKQAIAGGKIRAGEVPRKAASSVHVGDRLNILRGEDLFAIEVLALSEQRGPALLARQCYREIDAGRVAREAAAEQRRLARSGYEKPPTKPDKRARRLIRALGDIDAF